MMGWFGKKDKNSKSNNMFDVPIVKSPLKIGLALSGGGTRGVAYIGASRALQENGITFDYIAGTSVGSLMGAVYASGISLDDVEAKARQLSKKDILTNKIKFMPSKTDKFSALIGQLLEGRTFDSFSTPLTVVATDIISGKEIRITSGDISKAIAGSCAVPAIFKPVEFQDYRLYDGGLTNNIPADVVRDMGADVVISFDINPDRGYGTDSTKYFDELKAALRIIMKSNSLNGYVYSDYVVKLDLTRFDRTTLDDLDNMIYEGYAQTIEQMPEILKAIQKVKPDEDIKKTEKRIKLMDKARRKFEKQQQQLIDRGIIFDSSKKRESVVDVIKTKE